MLIDIHFDDYIFIFIKNIKSIKNIKNINKIYRYMNNYPMEAENYYSNQSQPSLNNMNMNMNTVVQSALPQDQTQTTNNSNSNSNSKQNQTFSQKINRFLNLNATTIMTTAIGISIGFAFKDLISSFAIHIIHPLIYKIVTRFDTNNYLNLQTLLTDNHTNFNFTTFAMALITFIIIFVSDYFINQNIGKIV